MVVDGAAIGTTRQVGQDGLGAGVLRSGVGGTAGEYSLATRSVTAAGNRHRPLDHRGTDTWQAAPPSEERRAVVLVHR